MKYLRNKLAQFKQWILSIVKLRFYKIRFELTVYYIVAKLHIKGKGKPIEVERSPYSESTYIYYRYDGGENGQNYVKIRVSSHYNKNDNSQIRVWV